ncbi:MAG: fatty-acyl-CoA synthase, partial [Candidatus Azotimanducaceae bacterium]
MDNIYQNQLDRQAANFAALSPLSFVARAGNLYPQAEAVVHGDLSRSWGEVYQRCVLMASALAARGIGKGDTVAVMLPNIPEMFEAHFFVPMTGAVLNAINTRLDPKTIAFILDHAEAKVLFTDREYAVVITQALALSQRDILVVNVEDSLFDGGVNIGDLTFDD